MTIRPQTHLLLPLLALGLALVLVASVQAQDRQYQGSGGTSATLRINFGTARHWVGISGTRVEELPQAERPDYDMFRYGGSYYAYNNNHWYMSGRESGDFTMIDDRSVPSDLTMVPRDHWRNYPSGWQERNDQGPYGTSASLQVNFGSTPHWTGIRGTRVDELPQAERPDYDMFRYGGSYYAYNNNHWYMSDRESGEFTMIDDRSVPSDLAMVPRDHWRNYPSGWQNRGYQGSDGTSGNLQINFENSPRWTNVRGTRVRMIRQSDRPDYDMFRYGRNYYIYSNNRWYVSRQWRGQFMMIDDRFVPAELSRVPREHWRNYPSDWADQYGNPRNGRDGQRR